MRKRLLAAAVTILCLSAPFHAWAADCVSPPSGLVAWWPGEGNAYDMTGTNNGALVNGATFAPGKVGQAFSFNGVNSYVQVPDDPSLHCTNGLTIEAWIYPTSSTGPYHNTVSKWAVPTQGTAAYASGLVPDGRVGLGVSASGNSLDSATLGEVFSTNTIPTNQWTHYAATYDGAELRIYVNGVCENVTAYNQGIFPATGELVIGAAGVFTDGSVLSPFAGLIDEATVYNRALSAVEIQSIYNAGSLGKCRGPIITRHPQSQVGFWGQSVTFTVAAVGVPPLFYQWQKDGTPIGAATASSLVLTNLQVSNAGAYSVVVSNSLGTTTSSNAFLTMNSAGVSIALYAGITIQGVVGLTYGIQSTTDLSNTNGWRGIVNVTLETPNELWFDVQPANQPKRYYRVVPGPISIP